MENSLLCDIRQYGIGATESDDGCFAKENTFLERGCDSNLATIQRDDWRQPKGQPDEGDFDCT